MANLTTFAKYQHPFFFFLIFDCPDINFFCNHFDISRNDLDLFRKIFYLNRVHKNKCKKRQQKKIII